MSARPLRFCMLTTFYPPASFGGDGIQVMRLSRELAERGHSVTVLHSPAAFRALGGEPAAGGDGDRGGVEVIGIDAGLGPISPTTSYLSGRPLLTGRRLRRELARGFDVLHFHNPSLLGGPKLLQMGDGLKLYTMHEQWLVCPTHVLWRNKREVCERRTCVTCSLHYRRPPQPWRLGGLLDRSVAALDALIAPSETTARLNGRFEDTTPIEVLEHFLSDPGRREPPPAGGARRRPYLLYAGRLESIKGIDRLIEAFETDLGVDLLIAGDGSLKKQLERAVARLPNVELLGWVGEGLGALYRDALAVVLPTLGHESCPLVLIEAQARGIPVIARRFGAQHELLEKSGGGLTYLSEAELRDAIRRLLEEPGLSERLGRRGRAAYERRWRAEVHISAYMEIIARHAEQRGEAGLAAAAVAAIG